MTYRTQDKQVNSFSLLLALVASPELSTRNYTQWGVKGFTSERPSLLIFRHVGNIFCISEL
jgi:hypothetical protein